ncbi:MAG: [Fe-Fe] hydrogenase large subunit C-terminal domain-containing protein [Paeniclostridium sordellii]|nr:[Fe-Fe] hydrogenase large subunit C-terminal domain-containing protein [Paeniclostridium sordellii]
MWFMRFSKANCKNCYACARVCPVNAIKIKNEHAQVIEERCIICGKCFKVCPQYAKIIKSDVYKVKEYISKGDKVIASIAPSFSAIFGEHSNKLKSLLKKLGFYDAQEAIYGIDLVEKAYEEYANKEDDLCYITSFCPSVTGLIQKHYPELIKNLIPIISPAVCHSKLIKAKYGEDVKVVFIGPCLSKKIEGVESGYIDTVLTFVELIEWINYENINIEELEIENFDCNNSQKRLFPIVGEPTKSIENKNPRKTIIQVEGSKDCIKMLKAIKIGKFKNTILELSFCRHSCLGGSGMPKDNINCYERRIRVRNYANSMENNTDEKIDEIYPLNNFSINMNREYKCLKKDLKIPNAIELREILKSMGKYIKKDELNCGSCGYSTCREKAVAVYNNMAEIEMCLPYMRDKAENLANTIVDVTPNMVTIVDKNLDIVKMNKSSEKFFNTNVEKYKGLPVILYLDEKPFEYVLDNKKNIIKEKVFLKDSSKVIIQSILWLEHNKVMLWIADDITENEELEKKLMEKKIDAMNITQAVIDKQMRVAQEIASLLGETTAETKVTLNKLKKLIQEEVVQ